MLIYKFHNEMMENIILKARKSCQLLSRRYCTTNLSTLVEKERKLHPYRKIHPWKSRKSFTKHLLDNVIYNKDGLVVINKPYGISRIQPKLNENDNKALRNMVNPCHYTLSDSLPDIANELGYSDLISVKGPERYMSGVTLLAANDTVIEAIKKSSLRAQGMNILQSTYWIVTTKLPTELKGKQKLALKLELKENVKKPVLLKKWGKNEVKRKDVKIFNVEFKVLSNSTHNLSSLIEIKASTRKWHAIRLFAATVLYSPVLGDYYHASRIQNIMGTWLNVNPFMESTKHQPKINKELLELLKLTPAKQEIIPAHIHLQKIRLPWFFGKDKDLVLEAPLLKPFDWTCEQLKFSHTMKRSKEDTDDVNDDVNIKQQSCQ